jgi:hypothetical protein
MTSLLVPADELMNRGGVAISGFGTTLTNSAVLATAAIQRQSGPSAKATPRWLYEYMA